MRDDVTRSCDLEYNNIHTHTHQDFARRNSVSISFPECQQAIPNIASQFV